MNKKNISISKEEVIIMGKIGKSSAEEVIGCRIKLIITHTSEKEIIKWKVYATRLSNVRVLTGSNVLLMPYNHLVLPHVSAFLLKLAWLSF